MILDWERGQEDDPTSFDQPPMALSPLSREPIPSPLLIAQIEPRPINYIKVCPKDKNSSSQKKSQSLIHAQKKNTKPSADHSKVEQDEAYRA